MAIYIISKEQHFISYIMNTYTNAEERDYSNIDYQNSEVISSLLSAEDVIILNLEERIENSRQQHKILDFVFYWRCAFAVKNPIIICSAEPLEYILKRQPKNYILCSPGIYHHTLGIEELPTIDMLPALDDLEKLKPYVRPAFDIEQLRHEEANWWTIKTFWDIQKIKVHNFDEDYPEKLNEKIKKINFVIANYLHGKDNFTLNTLIKNKIKQIEELIQNKEDILKQEEEIESLIKEKEEDKLFHELEKEDTLNIINNRYALDRSLAAQKLKKHNHELELIIKDIESKKEEKQQNFDKLIKLLNSIELEENSIEISTENSQTKKKVLIIDDMAEFGLDKVIENIITLNNGNEINSAKNFSCSAIKDLIRDNDPNLILLDLRLKSNESEYWKAEDFSGFQLMKEIKSSHPQIPIIIISASNKQLTKDKCIREGAIAYWNKPGVDENLDMHYMIKRYESLVDIINKVYSQDYQKILMWQRKIDRIKNDPTIWWFEYNKNCTTDTLYHVNAVKLQKFVFELIDEYLKYLNSFYFINNEIREIGFKNAKFLFYMYSALIIEAIHGFKLKNIEVSETLEKRKDTYALRIYRNRSRHAHFSKYNSQIFDLKELYSDVDDFLEYLNNMPTGLLTNIPPITREYDS